MERLIYNAIRTPDGTVLESRHRHDYREYTDKNGLEYMVDGGLEYTRRIIQDSAPYEELSVSLEDGHEAVRGAAKWGSFGRLADQPITYIKIKDMSTGHIQACLDNVPRMHAHYKIAFENELEFRKENKHE